MRIVEYCLLTALSEQELSTYVNSMISSGWQPFGSPSTVSEGMITRYSQAVVKYE